MERAVTKIDMYSAGYERTRKQAAAWQTASVRHMLKFSMDRLASACGHRMGHPHLLNHDAGVVDALTDILLERGVSAA